MCQNKLTLEQKSLAKLFYSLGYHSLSPDSSFDSVRDSVVSLMQSNRGLMRKYLRLGCSCKWRSLSRHFDDSQLSLFPDGGACA